MLFSPRFIMYIYGCLHYFFSLIFYPHLMHKLSLDISQFYRSAQLGQDSRHHLPKIQRQYPNYIWEVWGRGLFSAVELNSKNLCPISAYDICLQQKSVPYHPINSPTLNKVRKHAWCMFKIYMSLKLSGCFHCAFLSHSWHISDWQTRLASEGTFRHHTRNRYYTRMNDCIFYNCMTYITCIFSVWMSSKKPQRNWVMFLSMIYQRCRKQSQSMSPQLVLTYVTVVLNNMYITS